jgi:hypothetical protein
VRFPIAACLAVGIVVVTDTIRASVYLLRVGSTRYVAFNGARAGEFFSYFVLDPDFNFKFAYRM